MVLIHQVSFSLHFLTTRNVLSLTDSSLNFSLALKTPETVNEEDFIEITGATAGSLFLSFDMDDATVNGSPISPVKMSDMVISNKNDVSISTTQDITSFVSMMKSNSDKVKLEAASALLHVLSINHVNTGKSMYSFRDSLYSVSLKIR